ncbi:MAG: zinc-binding dehydrogenase [Candidatus Riflebacteria bacterium]|nr:zinc-binding dehydrogenase [Candidatus Riflebacteria bacterium]
MKAAILVESNKPLVIDEVFLPETLDFGQVLVKVFYSGICGSQLGEIDGAKGEDKFLPHLLGHEGSGEVLEIGPGVKYVKPGDHVVMHWRKGQGIEANPPAYKWQGKKLNAGSVTSFNEYAVVSENRLTVIPENFDLKVAPLLGCAVTTGLGVVLNNAKLKIGESIVVFGAGGVGLNVIQGAAMVSAYPIIAIDLFDNRLELAKKFGATHVVNSQKDSVEKEIRKILGSQGADVIVNNTSNTEITALACNLTQPQGRVILVGVPKKGDNASVYTLPLHFGKILTGSHGGESNPTVDIPRYVMLNLADKLNLKDLITEQFMLDDINKAITMMRNGEISGRCLINLHKL